MAKIKRFVMRWLYRLALGAATMGLLYKGDVVWATIRPTPETIERVVKVMVPEPRKTFAQLAAEIPAEYGIPEDIIAVLLEKESGTGGRMSAIRFEAHHMSRAGKLTKNSDEQRMYASSLCAMQIMGWHAPSYDLRWSDLLEPETCLRVGSDILRKCLDRHAGKTPLERIRQAAICYNGAESYGNHFVKLLGQRLISRMEIAEVRSQKNRRQS